MIETDYPHSDTTWPDSHQAGPRAPRRRRPRARDAVQDPARQRRAALPLHPRGPRGLTGRAAITEESCMTDIVASRSPFIDGAFVRGDGGTFTVTDPATEETVCDVEAASAEQFGAAIAAARRAFDDGPWPRMTIVRALPTCSTGSPTRSRPAAACSSRR